MLNPTSHYEAVLRVFLNEPIEIAPDHWLAAHFVQTVHQEDKVVTWTGVRFQTLQESVQLFSGIEFVDVVTVHSFKHQVFYTTLGSEHIQFDKKRDDNCSIRLLKGFEAHVG